MDEMNKKTEDSGKNTAEQSNTNEKEIKIPVLGIKIPQKTMLVCCFVGVFAIIIWIIVSSINHEHKFGEWEVVNEATCISEGLAEITCRCGEKITRTIYPLGHTEIIDQRIEPTCTSTGLSSGKHCTVCNQVFIEQQTLDMIDHIPGEWIIDKEATHTKDGNRHNECIMCDKVIDAETILSGQNKMKYTLMDDNTYEVSGIGSCTDREIIIPSEYKGLPVSRIAYQAFKGCRSFVSIKIPSSIKVIDESAFGECRYLETVVIENSLKSIGTRAFYECKSLKNVTIPNSVTSIGEEAFMSCSSLVSIVLPDSLTNIGDGLFTWCSSLTTVILPSNIKTISAQMFYSCDSLENFVIPDSVTSIDSKAFAFCNSLKSITLPKALNNIGENAFEYCGSLININYKGTKTQWNAIDKVEDKWSSIDSILDWDYNTGDYTVYCTDGTLKTK